MTKPLNAVESKPESRGRIERPEESNAERPVWETIAETGAEISDEEWKKVPDDSSVNYKHYLYGAPAKRV